MATAFDSFDRSPLGAFIQSAAKARGSAAVRIIGCTGYVNMRAGPGATKFSRLMKNDGGAWTDQTALLSVMPAKKLTRFSSSIVLGCLNALTSNAVTDSGGLLRSTDNGETWAAIGHGTNNLTVDSDGANCITADFRTLGIGVNHTTQTKIRKSTDGGANWTDVYNFPSYVLDSITYYPCGMASLCGAGGNYMVSAFRPAADNRLWRSTDSGATWSPILLANGGSIGLYRIPWCFCDAGGGVFLHGTMGSGGTVGESAAIFRSTDSGATWARITGTPGTGSTGSGHIVKIINMGGGVVVTAVNGLAGMIWRSADSGATWTKIYDMGSGLLHGMALVEGRLVAQLFTTRIYESTDGGYTWILLVDALQSIWDMA